MTVTEKIAAYLDRGRADGTLRPGDKLPPYAELMSMHKTSYNTVQKSLKNLEREGRIKIVNGIGSFISGGETLSVDFFIDKGIFDYEKTREICDRINRERELHLEIHFYDRNVDDALIEQRTEERPAAICLNRNISYNPLRMMDFRMFDDYNQVIGELYCSNKNFSGLQLPFYLGSTQAAVNPGLMKKIGFGNLPERFTTFDWWDDYLAACRNHTLPPSEKLWVEHGLWSFKGIIPFGLTILMNTIKTPETLYQLPFFDTTGGRRMLQIYKSLPTVDLKTRGTFWREECALELQVSSYLGQQPNRDHFQVVPFCVGTRKINFIDTRQLHVVMHNKFRIDEQKRIWEFLKGLLSKPIQKELMAMTGMISARKDMTIGDHAWAGRKDFEFFFPDRDSLLFPVQIFPADTVAALGTLYEQYENNVLGLDEVCRAMDRKVISAWQMT